MTPPFVVCPGCGRGGGSEERLSCLPCGHFLHASCAIDFATVNGVFCASCDRTVPGTITDLFLSFSEEGPVNQSDAQVDNSVACDSEAQTTHARSLQALALLRQKVKARESPYLSKQTQLQELIVQAKMAAEKVSEKAKFCGSLSLKLDMNKKILCDLNADCVRTARQAQAKEVLVKINDFAESLENQQFIEKAGNDMVSFILSFFDKCSVELTEAVATVTAVFDRFRGERKKEAKEIDTLIQRENFLKDEIGNLKSKILKIVKTENTRRQEIPKKRKLQEQENEPKPLIFESTKPDDDDFPFTFYRGGHFRFRSN